MPNIATYEAQDRKLQPSDLGEVSMVKAATREDILGTETANKIKEGAARVGQFAGGLVDRWAHGEIASSTAQLSVAHNNLMDDWNNTLKDADPNQPGIVQDYLDNKVNPALDNIRNGLHTQAAMDHFDQMTAGLKEHFHDQFTRDVEGVAAHAVDANLGVTVAEMSHAVAQNPASLPVMQQNLADTIDKLVRTSVNISPEHAAAIADEKKQKARVQLEENALTSVMLKSPDMAEKLLTTPDFKDLSGSQYVMAIRQIKQANRIEAHAARAEAMENMRLSQQHNTDQLFAKLGDASLAGQAPDVKGIMTNARDLLKRDQITFQQYTDLVSHMGNQTFSPNTLVQTDMGQVKALRDRMIENPPGTPGAVTEQEIMSHEGVDIGRVELHDLRTDLTTLKSDPSTLADMKELKVRLEGIKPYLAPNTGGGLDGLQSDLYSQFFVNTQRAFMRGRAAGYSVDDMLSPAGPHSLFSPEAINQYNMPNSVIIQKAIERMVSGKIGGASPGEEGAVSPPQPGMIDRIYNNLPGLQHMMQGGPPTVTRPTPASSGSPISDALKNLPGLIKLIPGQKILPTGNQ